MDYLDIAYLTLMLGIDPDDVQGFSIFDKDIISDFEERLLILDSFIEQLAAMF